MVIAAKMGEPWLGGGAGLTHGSHGQMMAMGCGNIVEVEVLQSFAVCVK